MKSPQFLTLKDVQDRLMVMCANAGGQKEFARQTGLSQPMLSLVLSGQRVPGPAMLKVMGLVREEAVYRDTSDQ